MSIEGHKHGDRIFVISDRIIQAKKFCVSNGINTRYLVFVNSVEKIKGLRDITLYMIGACFKQPYFDRIMVEARVRNFDVIEIGREWEG